MPWFLFSYRVLSHAFVGWFDKLNPWYYLIWPIYSRPSFNDEWTQEGDIVQWSNINRQKPNVFQFSHWCQGKFLSLRKELDMNYVHKKLLSQCKDEGLLLIDFFYKRLPWSTSNTHNSSKMNGFAAQDPPN